MESRIPLLGSSRCSHSVPLITSLTNSPRTISIVPKSTSSAMKYPKTCRQCRESKRKCTCEGLEEPCDTCRQRSLPCDGATLAKSSYNRPLAARRRLGNAPLASPNDAFIGGGVPELSQRMIVELVEHYLRAIQDKAHALFRSRTLRSQVQDKSILHTLLYAICATGAKFSANPEALIELKQYWPSVTAMISRLTRFHIICLFSVHSRPHQLDGKMVKVLVERSLRLDERGTYDAKHSVFGVRSCCLEGKRVVSERKIYGFLSLVCNALAHKIRRPFRAKLFRE